MSTLEPLPVGPEVVGLLLPHRRPFRMVDRLVGWSSTDDSGARLTACRFITANERIFDGHWPDWAVMPGAFTFEALGQTCAVLAALARLVDVYEQAGGTRADVVAALTNAERRATVRPGFDSDAHATLKEHLATSRGGGIGVAGAVSLKFVEPVFPGCRLDLAAEVERRAGAQLRYKVRATVDGRDVARGTITSSVITPG